MLLRFEEHGEVGLAPASSFGFARKAEAIPLSISEFAVAMRHFPIVFSMGERAMPIAVVGIEQRRNLFIGRDGSWRANSYVPAYVRRYPFIVSETPDKARQFLAIDRGSDRFVPSITAHQHGERLFDAVGKPTAIAQSALAFCQAWHADHANTVAFTQAMAGVQVLEPYHADICLPDGSQHQVNGFQAVNEKAFRALPAKTVAEWHANGWLDLVVLHRASLESFQSLLDLNAQRANERKALA
ncbi:SapC family protein [Rhizobium sp. ARZ01]|uniref:SapC family protein n=1 Tax=Rhizobium sp. ARZ01 TaxID=2769313 RepID=UPI0017829FBA|nr:SapC family protein [Rhizobium sp. ARZ01]